MAGSTKCQAEEEQAVDAESHHSFSEDEQAKQQAARGEQPPASADDSARMPVPADQVELDLDGLQGEETGGGFGDFGLAEEDQAVLVDGQKPAPVSGERKAFGRGRGGGGRGGGKRQQKAQREDKGAAAVAAQTCAACEEPIVNGRKWCTSHKDAYDSLEYQNSKRGGATKEKIAAWATTKANIVECARAVLSHAYENENRQRNGRWQKFDIISFRECMASKKSLAKKFKAIPMHYQEFIDFKLKGRGETPPAGIGAVAAHALWEALLESTPKALQEWDGPLDATGRPTVCLPVVIEKWLEGSDGLEHSRFLEKSTKDHDMNKKPLTDAQMNDMEQGIMKGHMEFGAGLFGAFGGAVATANGIQSSFSCGDAGGSMAPALDNGTPTKKARTSAEPSPNKAKDAPSTAAPQASLAQVCFARMAAQDRATESIASLQKRVPTNSTSVRLT